jgi:ribokinase
MSHASRCIAAPFAALCCAHCKIAEQVVLVLITSAAGYHLQVQAAAAELQKKGVGTVLVKLGSDGSLLIPQGSAAVRQQAVKVAKVVDTTGAGDCFTAAFAVATLEGKSDAAALQFASAAAALCVQQPGAMPSLPYREAVDQLLEQQS